MKMRWKPLLFILSGLLLIHAVLLSVLSNFHIGHFLEGALSAGFFLYALNFDTCKRRFHGMILVFCLIPCIFAAWLAVYGTNDNAADGMDAIIVPGAGIKGETVSGKLRERLDATVSYFDRNPDTIIVVCGGEGPQESIPEAMAMQRYLISRGIPDECILREDRSASTSENIHNAGRMLAERFPGGFSCVLVTNDYHVYRAVKIAIRAGIPAGHIGADTPWYDVPAEYLREMTAVLKMWVFP